MRFFTTGEISSFTLNRFVALVCFKAVAVLWSTVRLYTHMRVLPVLLMMTALPV